jgi:hypothetical protein
MSFSSLKTPSFLFEEFEEEKKKRKCRNGDEL